jgi:hypothetical protein
LEHAEDKELGSASKAKKMTFVALGFFVVLALLIFFKRQPVSNTDTSRPDNSQSSNRPLPNQDANVDLQPLRSVQESKSLDNVSVPVTPSPTVTVTPSGSEKSQEWVKNFEVSLSESVINQGMTQEVADCLLKASQRNLKSEKPVGFDALSDSCAREYQLSNEQREGLAKAFHNAVNASQPNVDIERWRSCMMSKYKAGSCVSDLIRANVEAFYTAKSGDAPMKKPAFQKERQAEIEKLFQAANKECPNNLNQLNGIYSNECT